MKQEIIFMPLGGGQRVGASCYYLKLGNSNIILDAGIGREGGCIFEPDYYSLLSSKYVESIGQINQIFISHAHMDHVGNLIPLMQEAGSANVYMTEVTKCLTEYQLYDKNFLTTHGGRESERLAVQTMLDRITTVNFLETLDFGEYKVTFYPAGHIPGAMMLLFEYGHRKILYTGDCSMDATPLSDGGIFPKEKDLDVMIMCGLHAKHPSYRKRMDGLDGFIDSLFRKVEKGTTVRCHISQLSKGVEFLTMLNQKNERGHCLLENSHSLLLVKENHLLRTEKSPHIYLTAEPFRKGGVGDEAVKVDFSLHEDFEEMHRIIRQMNPKQLYLVHCSSAYGKEDETIEQRIMLDAECRTQVVFAEEQTFYQV